MGKLKLSNKIGLLGEEIACKYLSQRGYDVVDRNWRENWGEIDIVAKNNGLITFFEVKSLARDMKSLSGGSVSYRPEDNVHPKKLERLSRVIQTYIQDKRYKGEWSFAVLAVYIDQHSKKARVEMIPEVLS